MATNDFVAFDSVTSIVERKISKVSLIGLKSNLLDKKVRFQAWLKRKEWRKRVGGFSPDGGLVDANDSRRRSLLEESPPWVVAWRSACSGDWAEGKRLQRMPISSPSSRRRRPPRRDPVVVPRSDGPAAGVASTACRGSPQVQNRLWHHRFRRSRHCDTIDPADPPIFQTITRPSLLNVVGLLIFRSLLLYGIFFFLEGGEGGRESLRTNVTCCTGTVKLI